jgi:hypothetical protein
MRRPRLKVCKSSGSRAAESSEKINAFRGKHIFKFDGFFGPDAWWNFLVGSSTTPKAGAKIIP